MKKKAYLKYKGDKDIAKGKQPLRGSAVGISA